MEENITKRIKENILKGKKMSEKEQLENRIKKNREKIELFKLNGKRDRITIINLEKEIDSLKLILSRFKDVKNY